MEAVIASPAAVLSILVQANTSTANRNLRSVQGTLTKTGSSARSATTHTDRFSSASSKLGGVLKGAAASAVGAAAAYVSVSQATNAISVTEDLAKATTGLHKTFGLTIKAASEWAAVASARGAEAGQLGIAFKTMASQISTAGHAATNVAAKSKALKSALDALHESEAKVADAEDTLARARAAAAEQIRTDQLQALDALHTAQEGLTQANFQARQSEIDLISARQDAARAIVDEQNAAIDAVLGHKGAVLSLKEARRALAALEGDPRSTGIELARARLAVQQAEQQVKETRIDSTRAQKDANRAEAAGVAGSEAVIDALHAKKQADQGVTDAVHSLTEAQRSYNRAQGETVAKNSQVISAEKSLQDAKHGVGDAQKKVDEAQKASGASSDAAVKALRQLGFSHKDIQKAMTDTDFALKKISEGFKNLPPGSDKATLASKLFGKQWQIVLPIIRDGKEAMQDQLDVANKYGATFGGKSLKSVNDLIGAQQELQLAMLGMQIQFTEKIAPALMTAGLAFAHFINQMRKGKGAGADVVNVLKTIAGGFGTVIDVLKNFTPFVQGAFDLLKLFLENVLDTFKILADVLRGDFGAALGHLKDLFTHTFGHILDFLGHMLSPFKSIGEKIGGRLIGGIRDAWNWVKRAASDLFGWLTWPFHKAWDVIKGFPDKIIGAVKYAFNWIKDHWKYLSPALMFPFDDAWDFIKDIPGKIVDVFGDAIDWVRNKWGDLTGLIKRPFEGLAGFVSGLFGDIKGAIGDAIGFIEDRIQDLVDAYNSLPFRGMSVEEVLSIARQHSHHRQRGGMIPGSGSGDTVPVMAEPGEGFINKKAVQALGGPAAINRINQAAPRFQKGGVVGDAGKVMEKLGLVNKNIGSLDERIDIANALSVAVNSPGGVEVTTSERSNLISLNKSLYGTLGGKRSLLNEGLKLFGAQEMRIEDRISRGTDYIHYLKKNYYGNKIDRLLDRRQGASIKQRAHIDYEIEKLKKERDKALKPLEAKLEKQKGRETTVSGQISDLTSQLVDVEGVTGQGGRLFEVSQVLAELGVTQTRGTALERLEAGFAQAQLTPGLTDDITWTQRIVDYWGAELARLKATGAPFGSITEAAGSLQSARDQLAQLQEQTVTPGRGTALDKLTLAWDKAQLSGGLTDDLSAAQELATYWRLQLGARTKQGAPFNEISEAASSLKQWQDTITDLKTQMTPTGRGSLLDRLQYGWDKSQLTPGLGDDLSAANQMAFYWKVQVDKLTKAKAPFGDISDALSNLNSWKGQVATITEAMQPEQPPGRGDLIDELQSNLALAGLTPDLQDDIYWQSQIVDYWTAKLAQLQTSGAPFSDITDAAQNLASARDALASLTAVGTPEGGGVTDNSKELLDLQAQLLGETQRKLLVSQAQMPVWAQFAGMFAKGGDIPAGMWGIAGEKGAEVVTGPATVTPQGEMGGDIYLSADIYIGDDKVGTIVDQRVEKMISSSRRRA